MAQPRILVLQHIDVEHPGIFRRFLREDGLSWTAVELDRGEPVPPLEDFDALWVMGGPMDVWQEAVNPWLVAEKAAIREAVLDRAMPFLGICLGHQLLAEALGGKVGPMATPEVGILEVELTEAGRADTLMRGIPSRVRCLQWHGAEVQVPPPGARVLASSPACRVQAMAVGDRAWGLQYHVELTETTIDDWGAIPEYEWSLNDTFGATGLADLKAASAESMDDFNRDARRLYENFMAVLHGVISVPPGGADRREQVGA